MRRTVNSDLLIFQLGTWYVPGRQSTYHIVTIDLIVHQYRVIAVASLFLLLCLPSYNVIFDLVSSDTDYCIVFCLVSLSVRHVIQIMIMHMSRMYTSKNVSVLCRCRYRFHRWYRKCWITNALLLTCDPSRHRCSATAGGQWRGWLFYIVHSDPGEPFFIGREFPAASVGWYGVV